jgi:hypothetical protein
MLAAMVGVIIPIGPSSADLARLEDLLESLARWEHSDELRLALIDDALSPRAFPTTGWSSTAIVRTSLWDRRRAPEPFAAMTAGTLMAVDALGEHCEFVVKLDVDALVIGSFVSKIGETFADDPTLGLVGSHDVTCLGEIRDWTVWHRDLRRLGRPVRFIRHGRRLFVQRRRLRDAHRARALLAEAHRNGYVLGASCLGGAYAISSQLASRHDLMDWRPWVGAALSEDVVMGVLCGAAGLNMRSLTAPGEPFGIAHIGLPKSPRELIAEGYSFAHAVKADPATEARWRQEFRAARR